MILINHRLVLIWSRISAFDSGYSLHTTGEADGPPGQTCSALDLRTMPSLVSLGLCSWQLQLSWNLFCFDFLGWVPARELHPVDEDNGEEVGWKVRRGLALLAWKLNVSSWDFSLQLPPLFPVKCLPMPFSLRDWDLPLDLVLQPVSYCP